MSQFLSILLLVAAICYFIFLCFQKLTGSSSSLEEAEKRLEQVNSKNFFLSEELGKYKAALKEQTDRTIEITKELVELNRKFEKLQHQKISADVKLGQKSEVLLPFLEDFPYKDDEIKGLYQPIDLIVFRNDEVVFVEVKSGQSQLSQKQRQIRDNIKAGKVRFEVHRMDENGMKVK